MRKGCLLTFFSMFLSITVMVSCSSENDGAAPPLQPTQVPAVQPTDSLSPGAAGAEIGGHAESGDPLEPDRLGLADAFAELVLGDQVVANYMTSPEIMCLAEGAFKVFSDERLDELGLNPASFAEAYQQPGLFVFGDWFDISDREAFELENLSLGCVDWRNFVANVLIQEGEPTDRARCIASQITVDGLRAVVRDAMVVDGGEGFGEAQDEVVQAVTACYLSESSVTDS